MPGVVNMEMGAQNGVRSDHDRGTKASNVNGINGSDSTSSSKNAPVEKGQSTGRPIENGGNMVNGGGQEGDGLAVSQHQTLQMTQQSVDNASRMNDLPEEIIHITQGFIPLSLLLTRLAQTSHNSLQEKVAELAKMPVPAGAVNGNTNLTPSAPDDNSGENIRKKGLLLNYVQDLHAKWVKALVIMEWSRKSKMVSKLIDLKFHIDQQRILYDISLDNMVNVKRDLTYARMPSPDLKTALQVLSTGAAPWMPDLQYIEPPPLTAQDQLKWMNDLNTLLSLRLNLEDYNKIPHYFKDYTISSGRVTFKVPGEFEVDLTIADEDFEKQFWFIDFRYAFHPSASSLPESLMAYLEGCVNNVLGKDGLSGCYQFLHEFVLTSKINELRRQASHLSKTSWTGALMVEPLNRALAIQYWTSRTSTTGLKSWVLVAVNSGRKQGAVADSKSPSHLVLKWYRDNKEMTDIQIDFNAENLSAEALLKTVVGKHIEYILTSIHDKMLTAPRFKSREAGMVLHTCETDPGASSLITQVGYDKKAALLIEPTTGVFAVKPHSKFSIQHEHQLNNGKSPIDDGVTCLESVRCGMMEDEIHRRGSSMGWTTRKSAMSVEELKSVTKVRDWTRILWLQKHGWALDWFVVVFLGLSGDEWWLLETNHADTAHSLKFQTRLPLSRGHPDLSDSFWNNLALFATGMIAQSVDMRELHHHRIKSRVNGSMNMSLPQQVRLPSIEMTLSSLFPAMVFDNLEVDAEQSTNDDTYTVDNIDLLAVMRGSVGTQLPQKQPWAHNIVTIKFNGVQATPRITGLGVEHDQILTCVSDAIIRVKRPGRYATLKGMVDGDVSYDPRRGEFSLRVRHRLGESLLALLKTRIKAIDRFVNFMESMDKIKDTIISESVSVGEVAFYYSEKTQESPEMEGNISPKRWRVVLDLSKDDISIKMEEGNPHLRVADLMRRLANSDEGIGALMAWLPASLPALNAVDEMEKEWEDIQRAGQGQLEFSMKTIAWIKLHYSVASLDSTGQHVMKRISLDVKVKLRRGEAWWHMFRSDTDVDEDAEDDFTAALKAIWDGKGKDWIGLSTGAAGKPDEGVTRMLIAVDEAIRAVVSTTASSAPIKTDMSRQNSTSHIQTTAKTSTTTQQRRDSIKSKNNSKPSGKGTNVRGNVKGGGGKGNPNKATTVEPQVVVLD